LNFRKSFTEKLLDNANYLCMILFSLSIIYPFYYIFINSINKNLAYGQIFLVLKAATLGYYKFIFKNDLLLNSFFITVSRTLIGVVFNIIILSMCGYALRKKGLAFRGLYLAIFTITMFFDGGLIPKYLTLKTLGMLDHFIVYILPDAFRFFVVIIFMSSFNDVPDSIEESAKIDGANDFIIYSRFYMYLILPVVATMALFEAVRHWNSWMDSVYFTSSRGLSTMQAVLVKLIKESNTQDYLADMQASNSVVNPDGIKFATIIVTVLPITMAYPFLQRFFIKGITVGSIKG
jgi:putative aldouronate transport system permease protein